MSEGLEGVEFYVMNTDAQALAASKVPNKIQIGAKITNGLGAGSDPNIGRQAALEDTERILGILEGADLVFVAAGLGGGTGAGASPVVATLAKELDALTIAIVTKPFTFEGGKRMRQAERSVDDLAASVDILTTIPNDRLLRIAPKGTTMSQAFRMADDVLRQAVEGISEIILTPGLINLDFSDIKAAISGMGHALIGTATAKGENAAVEAARARHQFAAARRHEIKGARQVLMNITGSSDIGLHELNEACSIIREAADCDDLQLNFGVIANDDMGDTVKVTIIATGFAPSGHPPAVTTPSAQTSSATRQAESDFFTPRQPEAPIAEPAPEPVMEAAPRTAPPEPVSKKNWTCRPIFARAVCWVEVPGTRLSAALFRALRRTSRLRRTHFAGTELIFIDPHRRLTVHHANHAPLGHQLERNLILEPRRPIHGNLQQLPRLQRTRRRITALYC